MPLSPQIISLDNIQLIQGQQKRRNSLLLSSPSPINSPSSVFYLIQYEFSATSVPTISPVPLHSGNKCIYSPKTASQSLCSPINRYLSDIGCLLQTNSIRCFKQKCLYFFLKKSHNKLAKIQKWQLHTVEKTSVAEFIWLQCLEIANCQKKLVRQYLFFKKEHTLTHTHSQKPLAPNEAKLLQQKKTATLESFLNMLK